MALQYAYSNHNNAAEYQVSSVPFLHTETINAGVEVHVKFPYVTRFLVIRAASQDVNLLFSSTGDDGGKTNFFIIQSGSVTPRLELKCRELWVKNASAGNTSVSILAGLTNVPYSQFPDLASLNISGIG